MLFYLDPYADKQAYPRLFTHRDEEGTVTTRLMFDRSENDVILFQERRVSSRMISNVARFNAKTAEVFFPQHAKQIAELVK